MLEDDLPLYDLFTRLRAAEFPLGVSDYNLLLQVLLAGYDTPDRIAFKQLCQTLWVKSVSQLRQFEAIFDEMVVQPQSLKSLPQKEEQTSTATLNHDTEQNDQSSDHTQVDEFKDEYFFFAPTPDPEFSESAEEVEVARAVRTGKQREWVSFKPLGLPDEYFPVTARQMEQGWYTLRRPIREGVRLELDIAATIDQTKRRGKFFHPVQRPRQVKSSQLLLLIDQKGSMQPFHVLSRLLVETALQTGCLDTTNCYYFNNYPRSVLYGDPQFQTESPVNEVMKRLNPNRTVILIFSDAGAARGDFIPRRIKQTNAFLEQMQQHCKALTWLNPMPHDSWQDTTAEAIAYTKIVQMFPADRSGFENAIKVLDISEKQCRDAKFRVSTGVVDNAQLISGDVYCND